MKSDTHPTWHDDCTVTCACGHTFTTGSTKDSIQVDICSHCHPFFTGEMRFVDVQGRVEKFQAKQKAAQKFQADKKAKKTAKKQVRPQTLKEMLVSEKKRLEKDTSQAKPSKA